MDSDYDATGSYLSSESEHVMADTEDVSRILLMGLKRAGKSSIHRTVFHKMSPHETLFLESTTKIVKNDIANNTFVRFQVWDFPGDFNIDEDAFDTDAVFRDCGALLYVIDAQDDYEESLAMLNNIVDKAYAANPSINVECFIHKVDGLPDDAKIETQRDIHQRVTEELSDAKIELHPTFYLTSIYDHSVCEAFSQVLQKLIPQLPALENLLDIFISNCHVEKAFLFDVVSKIYIATDPSPVDMQTYELTSDSLDVVIDLSCIYGLDGASEEQGIAFDEKSASVIRMKSGGHVLYLREVNRYLALVCILREENWERVGLIDHNINVLKESLQHLFDPRARRAMH